MRSSKNGIFVRILLATMVPLCLIYSLTFFSINGIIREKTSKIILDTTLLYTDQVAKHIETKIDNLTNVLNVFVDELQKIDPTLRNADEEANQSLLSFLKTLPAHGMWFDFSPSAQRNGQRLSNGYMKHGETLDAIKGLENEFLTDLYGNDSGVNVFFAKRKFFVKDHDGTLGSIYRPILRDQKVVGIAGIEILYEDFFSSVRAVKSFEGYSKISLVSLDGKVLYSQSRDASETVAGWPNEEMLKKSAQDKAGFVSHLTSSQGEKNRFIWISPISAGSQNPPFFLALELPAEFVYQQAFRSTQAILVISILGFLLLAVSLFFATRVIVRAIEATTEIANRIASGTIDDLARIQGEMEHPATSTEIDVMNAALKKMMAGLLQMHKLEIQSVASGVEREKLIAQGRAKMEFFADMSHEIRTPMNAISGLSDILLADKITNSQREHIKDIKISAEALIKIVGDILDISKMDVGKLTLKPTHFNFLSMLDNVSSLAKMMAQEKGLKFSYQPESPLPLCLFGDEIRFRQILLNLIGNAVKYTPKGRLSLVIAEQEERLHFIVSDTGIGMKPESLAIIFEAFSQVNDRQTKYIQGTGLGLSITKNLVQMMGGEIHVTSTYGEGSSFHVLLPKVLGDESALTVSADNLSDFYAPSAKILVVDDNKINLNVASGLLAILGINSDTALSGIEAISLVQENDYDLVFMDHMMPDMDGFETTTRIRALGDRYEISRLPIVALTANVFIGNEERLTKKGLNGLLTKPIEASKLIEVLKKYLPTERWEDRPPDITPDNGHELSPLLQQALKIRELDVSLGLERVADQQAVFEKSLKLAGEQLTQSLENLKTARVEQDIVRFHTEVHGLKGCLANIGAMPLAQLARELETAAKEMDWPYCEQNMDPFVERTQLFAKALSHLCALEAPKRPKSLGDTQALMSCLETLSAAIASYDYEGALSLLESLEKVQWSDDIRSKLDVFRDALDHFDYERAQQNIETLLDQLASK